MAQQIKNRRLDLFQKTPLVSSIVTTDWLEFHPIAQINSGNSVEFHIPEMIYHYIDLKKTQIRLKTAIERIDGKAMSAETDLVAPCNLILSSAFSQCIVSLQQQVITSTVGCNYPYKGYLDVLLSDCSGWDFVNELRCEGYYKDGGNFDSISDSVALRQNLEATLGGKEWVVQGGLRIDICEQNKLILNNIAVRIKLIQSLDSFRLVRNNGVDYRLVLKDAALKLCRIRVSDEELVLNEEKLKHQMATYFFYRSDLRTHNLPQGAWSTTLDDLYHGDIPSQVVVAMVSAKAYSGDFECSPFKFDHYWANFLELTINGTSVPCEAMKPNFKDGNYTDAYLSLFPHKRRSLISFDDYKNGYSIFLFSVSNHITDTTAASPTKGHVRLTIHFSQSLREPISILLYARFADEIGVDAARNIILL